MLTGKNKRKMCKKALCLIFAFLFSINSFAAIVSDNDGSAFVTKSEFDSLKKNFANQIDQYNTSIDSKIDGAIAAYLAGMDLAKEPTNFFETLKKVLGEVRFLNGIKTTNSTITTNEILNVYRHYYQKRYTGMVYIFKFYPAVLSTGRLQYTMNTALIKNGTAGSYTDKTSSTFLFKHATSDWSSTGTANSQWIPGPTGNFATDGTQSGLGTKNVYGTNDKQVVTNGAGILYTYKTTPIGRKVITQYNTAYYPVCILNVYGHSYIDYAKNFWTNYKGSNLQKDTTSLSCTIDSTQLLKFGNVGTGTPYPATHTGSAETRWNAQVYTISTTDSFKYETAIWGLVPSDSIYCIDQNATLVSGTTTTKPASDTQTTIKGENWGSCNGMEESDVTMSGVAVTYTPPKLNTESRKIDYFCNDYLSTAVGETVYHGQGAKIAELPQDGDLDVTMKFKNAGSENASFKFILTNGKVGAPGTAILNNYETVPCNGTVTITRRVSFDKKGDLWINCYSNTTGVDLILEDVKLKLS